MAAGRWIGSIPMPSDVLVVTAWLALALFITLPSLAAWQQKLRSREGAEVASALAEFAARVRREQHSPSIDEVLLTRARRLGLIEMVAFEFVCRLPGAAPESVAGA